MNYKVIEATPAFTYEGSHVVESDSETYQMGLTVLEDFIQIGCMRTGAFDNSSVFSPAGSSRNTFSKLQREIEKVVFNHTTLSDKMNQDSTENISHLQKEINDHQSIGSLKSAEYSPTKEPPKRHTSFNNGPRDIIELDEIVKTEHSVETKPLLEEESPAELTVIYVPPFIMPNGLVK